MIERLLVRLRIIWQPYLEGIKWAEEMTEQHGFMRLLEIYSEMVECDLDYNDFNRGVEGYINHYKCVLEPMEVTHD